MLLLNQKKNKKYRVFLIAGLALSISFNANPVDNESQDSVKSVCNQDSYEHMVFVGEKALPENADAKSIASVNHYLIDQALVAKADGVICIPKSEKHHKGLARLSEYVSAGLYDGDFGYLLSTESDLSNYFARITRTEINQKVQINTEHNYVENYSAIDGYIVDIKAKNKSIADILNALGKQTRLNFLFSEETLGKSLSLYKTNIPLSKALDLLASSINALWQFSPGVVTFVAPEDSGYGSYLTYELYQPSYLTASELMGFIPPNLIDRVQSTMEAQGLMISGTPRQVKQIIRMLKRIDKKPAMLALEAIIADVEHRHSLQFGIDWWSNTEFNLSANGVQFGFLGGQNGLSVSADRDTGAVEIVDSVALNPLNAPLKFLVQSIKALEEEGEANILATPKVITASGKTARINIKTQQIVPVLSGSLTYPQVMTKDYETGVKLEITPVLTRNGDIYLTIHNAGVGTLTLAGAYQSDGNKLPVVTQREISTTINVGNEQVLAIGGLLDATHVDYTKSFPGVKAGTYEKNQRTRNLMIFIKPSLIKVGD
ncbi:MAG: hypothetical protein OXE99_12210 [Cellvibrionales bacterium]|nr:hypothetical protein [Cellvibrionales bacterium]